MGSEKSTVLQRSGYKYMASPIRGQSSVIVRSKNSCMDISACKGRMVEQIEESKSEVVTSLDNQFSHAKLIAYYKRCL